MYDITTGKVTRVTSTTVNEEGPQIYQNKIVWTARVDTGGGPPSYMGRNNIYLATIS